MKNIIAFLIFVLFAVNTFADNNVDKLVDSANNCYNKTKYSEALAMYNTVYEMNYVSSNLFYNMANCYYKLDDIANAVYFYEKSLLLNPHNSDAEYNLKLTNQKLEQKVDSLLVPFYTRWYNAIVNAMSADAWAIFSIIMFVITLAGISLYLFVNVLSLRKIGFFTAIVTLLLFILSMIIAYRSASKIKENNLAIVFEESLVKSSPNADAVNLFKICKGLKVEVIDSVNNLYNVKLSDGKQGWIDSNNLKKISNEY